MVLTIYIPFKSIRIRFEKYKSGISFISLTARQTFYLIFHSSIFTLNLKAKLKWKWSKNKKLVKWSNISFLNKYCRSLDRKQWPENCSCKIAQRKIAHKKFLCGLGLGLRLELGATFWGSNVPGDSFPIIQKATEKKEISSFLKNIVTSLFTFLWKACAICEFWF